MLCFDKWYDITLFEILKLTNGHTDTQRPSSYVA